MKKLSIEQKARRYDEALKVIKGNLDALNEITETGAETVNIQSIKNCFYRAFPEFKESEDEKTMKDLLNFLKSPFIKDNICNWKVDPWIAWLEKQGEQKPIDKIESTFHESDWIVQENIGVYKIIEVCESWYEVIDIEDNHYSISFDKEYMCHLWSIKDAKEGDVLSGNYGTFIFMGENDGYCGILSDNSFIRSTGNNEWIECLYPATKEQRDTLFTKMKEAGYEWDNENKEPKIIDWNKHIKYESNSPSIIKESDWSEDDEEKFRDVIRLIEQDAPVQSMRDHYTNWFKSLKDRYAWTPSEDQMNALDNALSLVKNCGEDYSFDLRTLYEQLKKLKD